MKQKILLVLLVTLQQVAFGASEGALDPVIGEISKIRNAPWQCNAATAPTFEHSLEQDIAAMAEMRPFLEANGKVAKFNNEVHIVQLADGTKGAFKPKSPEDQDSAIGEVVAYRIALELAKITGHLLVPPTVLKEHPSDGRIGSLQWFVESPWDLWKDEDRATALRLLSPALKDEGALFCHAFQWDTHPGNYMIAEGQGETPVYLALIDNEGIVNAKVVREYGERHYVKVARSDVSEEALTFGSLENPTVETMRATFVGTPETRLQGIHRSYFGATAQDTSITIRYALGQGGLWLQRHAGNAKAFPVKSERLDPLVRAAYEDLMPKLSDLCMPLRDFDATRFGDSFITAMQARIQMALDAFEKA